MPRFHLANHHSGPAASREQVLPIVRDRDGRPCVVVTQERVLPITRNRRGDLGVLVPA